MLVILSKPGYLRKWLARRLLQGNHAMMVGTRRGGWWWWWNGFRLPGWEGGSGTTVGTRQNGEEGCRVSTHFQHLLLVVCLIVLEAAHTIQATLECLLFIYLFLKQKQMPVFELGTLINFHSRVSVDSRPCHLWACRIPGFSPLRGILAHCPLHKRPHFN